ncbi:MAG: efflux RND transporter permease subunit [Endomicrobium sp.]|jgi:HAE1 family hydrophobic/amphiphilic exporter-1|nr:efflux RND transporter permease subunit [Endomicrobium sp.]
MKLTNLSIKRPTLITSILVGIILLGIFCYEELSVKLFPAYNISYVIVYTVYPVADIKEIEDLVTKPIEDFLNTVEGLDKLESISQNNISVVICSFKSSKNSNDAINEVRNKIYSVINLLPGGIKDPIVMNADFYSHSLLVMNLKSDIMDIQELHSFANDVVKMDLEKITGIAEAQIIGGTKREIHVVVDRKKLEESGLFLSALAKRIELNTVRIPAGNLIRKGKEIYVITSGQFESLKQMESCVINFIANDRPVLLKDVAYIEDSFAEETLKARVDRRIENTVSYTPSVLINVFAQPNTNDVAVADVIYKGVKELNEKYKNYKGSPSIEIIDDFSAIVRKSIGDARNNIFEGIFLTIITVYLFLGNWRSTFITSLALPNSLIGAFIFMYIFGFSLNLITLMAFSLAIGLLIDDAVVVRENIFRHYDGGENNIDSAIKGTNEMTLSVIATTLVVIAVFLPLSFIKGLYGQFYKEFSLTIIFILIISTLDALTIAPMLSVHLVPEHKKLTKGYKFIRYFRYFTVFWFNIVFDSVKSFYKKLILFILERDLIRIRFWHKNNFVLSWKLTILFIAVIIFLITIFTAYKKLNISLFPELETGEFSIFVTADPGISLEQMDRYSKEAETLIMNDPNVEFVYSLVGSLNRFITFPNISEIRVKLCHSLLKRISRNNLRTQIITRKKRDKLSSSTMSVKNDLRDKLNQRFKGLLSFYIVQNVNNRSESSDISIELSGTDIDILYNFSKHLMEKFEHIPHFVDIHSNYQPSKPGIQIHLDFERMKNVGANSVMTGAEVRGMLTGIMAGKYKESGKEFDIKVKLNDKQKDIFQNFNDIYVNNLNNTLIKLSDISYLKKEKSPVQMFRIGRERYVKIEGSMDNLNSLNDIRKAILNIFNEEKNNKNNPVEWKNIKLTIGGDVKDMDDMFVSVGISTLFSILFTFIVLASLYESTLAPLLIMTPLPLAIIGGITALLLSGNSLNIFALIGMVMLLGVASKNSIVLVNYIQQLLRSGKNMREAIIEACVIRLRPIVMTSFALVAGTLPMALGLSEVGKFRQSMGIVVIGGILSSTILSFDNYSGNV